MNVMKILFVAPIPPPYGGIANWVLLMQRYIKSKNDLDLVGIVDVSPKKRDLDGRSLWDRIIIQGFQMLKLNKKLKKTIKQEKPDVLHMTTSGQFAIIRDIFLLRTSKKMKIPSVYHIRFGRIPEISERNTIEWKLLKRAINLSDKIVAIDEKTDKSLKKFFDNKKIVKIANPFDIEKINVKKLENNTKTIVFLCWCQKTKGIEELLGAWEKISNKYIEWELKLIGPINSEYQKELISKYSMERVIMTGEKEHDEALSMLNEASVFILPSYTEGFPNAILEAMALEKPIIATDVGAISEMLENDSGIIIPPRNKDAIIEALENVLSNSKLRNDLGKNAKFNLLKNFTIEVVFQKYKDVWKEVKNKDENI